MNTNEENNLSVTQIWHQHSLGIAWGTVLLFFGVIAASISLIFSLSNHLITPIAAIPFSSLLIYLSFTVLHEAGHGNIAQGVSWMKPLERIMGWVSIMPFIIIPFPLFARIHDHHHAFTNDPDRDPDYWVSSSSWIRASLKAFCLVLHYLRHITLEHLHDPIIAKTAKSSIIYWLIMGATITTLIYYDHGYIVLVSWAIPATLAAFVLAMLFDWIPHTPNTQQNRFQNTRIYLGPALNFLTLGQNYHLIHHLNPRIPWYRYKNIFILVRRELEDNNAPIESLYNDGLPKVFTAQSAHKALNNNKPFKATLTVADITKETSESIRITFASLSGEKIKFKAGQYVTIGKKIDHQYVSRCYSICAPENSTKLSIAVKNIPNGIMSSYLNSALRIGDQLTVSGPFGNFTLPETIASKHYCFIGAGSGITPLISLLQTLLHNDTETKIDLIYYNQSVKTIMFKEKLIELETQYSNRFITHHIIKESETSLPTRPEKRFNKEQLIKILAPTEDETINTIYYICGPSTLKKTAKKALLDLNVPQKNILIENYTIETQKPKGSIYNVSVKLSDQTYQFKVAENQTVLEVAKQQKIPLPFACSIGQCGCCMLQIDKGEDIIDPSKSTAILPSERIQSKTLACQCRPTSDLYLSEVYD